jgi:hypothetical protein
MQVDQGAFETKGVPTVYCNLTVTSLSYSDIRVYVLEQSPGELVLNPKTTELVQKPPLNEAKVCLVFSPEFAASLVKSLSETVAQYQSIFGPLRPQPTEEGLAAAIAAQQKGAGE